jgi:hypothetical protein
MKRTRHFRRFIAKCLQNEAEKRSSATDLLNSEFLKKFARDGVLNRDFFSRIPAGYLDELHDELRDELRETAPNSAPKLSGDRKSWDFGGLVPRQPGEGYGEDGAAGGGGAAVETSTAAIDAVTQLKFTLQMRKIGSAEMVQISFMFALDGPNPDSEKGIVKELVDNHLINIADADKVAQAMASLRNTSEPRFRRFPLFGTEVVEGDDGSAFQLKVQEGFAQLKIGETKIPEEMQAAALQ